MPDRVAHRGAARSARRAPRHHGPRLPRRRRRCWRATPRARGRGPHAATCTAAPAGVRHDGGGMRWHPCTAALTTDTHARRRLTHVASVGSEWPGSSDWSWIDTQPRVTGLQAPTPCSTFPCPAAAGWPPRLQTHAVRAARVAATACSRCTAPRARAHGRRAPQRAGPPCAGARGPGARRGLSASSRPSLTSRSASARAPWSAAPGPAPRAARQAAARRALAARRRCPGASGPDARQAASGRSTWRAYAALRCR